MISIKSDNDFFEELKFVMANKTKEELLEQWERSKEFDSIGPTVGNFLRTTNLANKMFRESKPLGDLETKVLNETMKRISKKNPTLPGRK